MNLREQLNKEAEKWGIIVEDVHDGVELRTKPGFQFDRELHGLVTSRWDNEPFPNVLRRAIKDARENGPYIQPCPKGCPCEEVD